MDTQRGLILTPVQRKRFQASVLRFYRSSGRQFSWRKTRDPYRILVSEIMLQQTQTARVERFFKAFLKTFPTVQSLAHAPLVKVLRQWQGLGYNRRAKFLHQAAKVITTHFQGKLPHQIEELEALPGIGHYTARAVATFAFNQPHAFVETNIRAVFIAEFFPQRTKVSDKQLLSVIERTIYQRDPRRWYYALMDYGVYLKSKDRTLTGRGSAYTPQSKFQGSVRQMRGRILKELLSHALSERALRENLDLKDEVLFERALQGLLTEQLVMRNSKGSLRIA